MDDGKQAAEFLGKMKREVATGDLRSEAGDLVKIPKLLEQQEYCNEGTIANAMQEILTMKAGATSNIRKSYDAMVQVLSKMYPRAKWLPKLLCKDIKVDSLKRAYRENAKRFLLYDKQLSSLEKSLENKVSPNTLWERFVLAISKSKLAKTAQSR